MKTSRIDELLDRWEDLAEQGTKISAEELCRNDPDLRDQLEIRIRALSKVAWMNQTDAAVAVAAPNDTDAPMRISRTATDFAETVRGRGFLSPQDMERLRQHVAEHGEPTDGQTLADEMVAAGILTSYQAQVLLQEGDAPLLIDRYLILDKVGAGGMGVVYKALHQSMNRVVALKVLPPTAVDSADKVERFRREARAAAKLSHPNIVTVFDAAESNGTHFLAMEYVDGPDLQRVVREQGPLSVPLAVNYIRDASQALQHVHEQGIVHRDIKPANLLLATDHSVKVADLGLATIERTGADDESHQQITQDGELLGTIAFLAPEQAIESRQTDLRSDIYSLGATFFYLLTGRPPFHNRSAIEMLLAHREHPVPSLREIRQDVPEALDQVVAKMMAKQPEDRFASMAEVNTSLANVPLADVTDSPSAVEFVLDADTGSVVAACEQTAEQPPVPTPQRYSVADSEGKGKNVGRIWLLFGAIILACGIVILVKTPDGQSIRMTFPSDSEITVKNGADVVIRLSSSSHKTGVRQSEIRTPVNLEQIIARGQRLQESWAKQVDVPVEIQSIIGTKLRLIPPGEFLMGSTEAEEEPEISTNENEQPRHRVRLTRAFYMSVYEQTQQEFERVLKRNPSYIGGPSVERHPVERCPWHSAIEFCNALSRLDGLDPYYDADGSIRGGTGYRLPTEAEWEYACRAGTDTPYWFGSERKELIKYGWAGVVDSTHEVGLLPPNPFGLYDMHGNVWEWCQDWYAEFEYAVRSGHGTMLVENPSGPVTGAYRTLKGGSWHDHMYRARSAERSYLEPNGASEDDGFRVVRYVD